MGRRGRVDHPAPVDDCANKKRFKESMRWTQQLRNITWETASKDNLTQWGRDNVNFWKAFQKNQAAASGKLMQTEFGKLLERLPEEAYEKFPRTDTDTTDARRVAQLFIHMPSAVQISLVHIESHRRACCSSSSVVGVGVFVVV